MSDPPRYVQTNSKSAGQGGLPRPDLSPSWRPYSASDWAHVVGGIAVAGGVYPILLSLLNLLIAAAVILVLLFYDPPSASEILGALAVVPQVMFIAVIAAVVCTAYTAAIALPTTVLFYVFVWSLRLRASLRLLGAVLGGLVGFLAFLPFPFIATVKLSINPFWDVLLTLAFGPCLTTVLGQAGGAWGGWHGSRQESDVAWADTLASAGGWRPPHDRSSESTTQPRPLLRFQIRHLLWVSVWVGLLLAAMRLIGVPFEWVLPAVGIWLVYQAATLWLGAKVLKRVGRWRAARRST